MVWPTLRSKTDKEQNRIAPSVRSSLVDYARPLVRVSALCSLQCFDTDGWVAERTHYITLELFRVA